MSRLLPTLFGLSLCGVAWAADPTAPPASRSEEPRATEQQAPLQALQLYAVLRNRNQSRAVINGQSLAVGESIFEARVIEIRPQAVLVERQGSREWLRLAAPIFQESR